MHNAYQLNIAWGSGRVPCPWRSCYPGEMKQLLTYGLSLLWNPHSSWLKLRTETIAAGELVAYVMILSMWALLMRVLGYLAVQPDWGVLKAVSGALLFVLLVVGSASMAGIVVAVMARRANVPFPDALAQRVMLVSATPVLVLCVIYPIARVDWLHTVVFLSTLGWGGYLVFRGLWAMLALGRREVLSISLVASATWILSATVLVQVVHITLSAS